MAGFETGVAAIAVVQVTLKVLNLGHTVLSDVKNYGADARRLSLKFQQNSHRYDSLQKILFESKKYPFLHGSNLFNVLPDRSQSIISQLLLELLQLLYVHFALEQKYAASSKPPHSRPAFENHNGLTSEEEKIVFQGTTARNDIESHIASQLMSVIGWSWALRGKKKAVRLNTEFEDWLRRTMAIIEDTSWTLPQFNVLANLNALQSDSDARISGLATSAQLRRLVIDKTNLPVDLNEPWDNVKITKDIASGKTVGKLGEINVLVETFAFPLDEDGNLPDIFEERFSKIVRLLNCQTDPEFRVLQCLKYSSQISDTSAKIRLISRVSDSSSTPTILTLAEIYRGIKSDERPSLGARFSMCHQLADSVFLLHSVDWVHRALRSDNIIFIFPNDDLNRTALHQAELRISGFETSRPSTDSSLGPYDNQIARNVYRHPKRWGTPRELFTQTHDVYSLGVLLLEIGLWEKAEDMISTLKPEQRHPERVSQHLQRHTNERLAHRCGDLFANAVRKCLTLNFYEDTESFTDLERQQKIHMGLLEQVVDPLKLLRNAV